MPAVGPERDAVHPLSQIRAGEQTAFFGGQSHHTAEFPLRLDHHVQPSTPDERRNDEEGACPRVLVLPKQGRGSVATIGLRIEGRVEPFGGGLAVVTPLGFRCQFGQLGDLSQRRCREVILHRAGQGIAVPQPESVLPQVRPEHTFTRRPLDREDDRGEGFGQQDTLIGADHNDQASALVVDRGPEPLQFVLQ